MSHSEETDFRIEEVTPELALSGAIRLLQADRLDDAERILDVLLDNYPNIPEFLHFYGILAHRKGRDHVAIESIEKAVALAPGYADAHNNLGNIYNKAGLPEKAVAAYRRAIEVSSGNAAAYNNLGTVLKDLDRLEEAAQAFAKAIELMPEYAGFYHNYGNVFRKQGKFGEAAEAFRKAINLRPYRSEDYENLCHVLYLQGLIEEALPTLRQWLEHDPTNPLAVHRLHSYTGSCAPARASDDYVRMTFDSFADSFDDVLKALDYRAPGLVKESIATLYGPDSGGLEVLDAGCGTGLCGEFLRPYAERLVGVDLSANMLEKARARRRYDDLIEAELTDFIGRHTDRFDLIVSADTLVYFGDLREVFDRVAKALQRDGYFIFTVEAADQGPPTGYQLNPHGRYSHTEEYLRHGLTSTGLIAHRIEPQMLRYEAGVPVDGFLVVATRS
ncbi:methyltransferase type 11 [Methylocaldum marinum]|uniref:Methyltransferase type 11 n=1 Tax=Methylocaldum marinum TaxID=1432792 RepID=A0A250KN93_9GAMM|nr:tetratricopeptide repeat protein [Methylocaldum marinum]BBA33135.1 methyltransferase type 11 [Methylocaldum marinum]